MSMTERSRISPAQRALMLGFIKKHPVIATGRTEGPEGALARARLLDEMANVLNGEASGATKTPEKWLRSWQDWKSDVKKKAGALSRHARGTGGSSPKPDLTDLERELVQFIWPTSISGMAMPDPLDIPESEPEPEQKPSTSMQVPISPTTAPMCSEFDDEPESPPPKRIKTNNESGVEERMVVAMEQQAQATREIARQLERLADVAVEIIRGWNEHKVEHL